MNTSYYAKSHNHPNAVSIAGKAPHWYKGREYKKLAPKWWFFSRYKEDGNEEAYIDAYLEEVLDKLDPQEVYKDLGENAVMLCWESSDKFCHRHIVAGWLEHHLGIEIEELTYEEDEETQDVEINPKWVKY